MREQLPIVSPPRSHVLDAVRFLAVLLLIPFHAAALFYRGDLGEFYVAKYSSSAALSGFLVLVHQWHMPIFFFLAGAASWHSLQVRRARSDMQERLRRLLLPLVAGVFTLVPPQIYVRFYPRFLDSIRPAGHCEWAHLWFLAVLLVITVLCLPLRLKLNQQRITGVQGDDQPSGPGFFSPLLLALPLMLTRREGIPAPS